MTLTNFIIKLFIDVYLILIYINMQLIWLFQLVINSPHYGILIISDFLHTLLLQIYSIDQLRKPLVMYFSSLIEQNLLLYN